MKIALGTVQFGSHYGVANSAGQVSKSEAERILAYAKSSGVNTIDTAVAYGSSQDCLGEIGVHEYQVVSKLQHIPDDFGDLELWVSSQVDRSLEVLGIEKLSGLLLHRPGQLYDPGKEKLWDHLANLKKEGKTEKIGFSIYSPEELETLCKSYSPDLVQAPYSVFDRRLEQSGWLQRLSDNSVEIHIRSIFLQGLLLMGESRIPKRFSKWTTEFSRWFHWLEENKVDPLQAAISFALSDERVSRAIVGVDSLEQFRDIVNAANNLGKYPENLSITDPVLLNPTNWASL